MTEPEWRRLNRANWDERVPAHLAPESDYDMAALRAEAADVDTGIRSMGRFNAGGTSATELAALARPKALDT